MTDGSTVHDVLLTAGAERDLASLYDYIEATSGTGPADHVLDRLMQVVDSLRRFPHRGSHPRELLALGIRAYRQTFFKPYRVIYQVMDSRVVVVLIVDGRRDLQTVLARRLLDP